MKDNCIKRIEELFEKYEKDVNLCLKVYEIIKTAEEEERPGLFKQVALLLKRSNFIEKEKMCGISDEEIEKLEQMLTMKNHSFLNYARVKARENIAFPNYYDQLVWNYIEGFENLYERAFAIFDIGIDRRYPYIEIEDFTNYLLTQDEFKHLLEKSDLEREIKLKYILNSEHFIQFTQVAYALLKILDECDSEEEKIVMMLEIIKFYITQ